MDYYARRSLRRMSSAASRSTSGNATRASTPCRTSALNRLVWPIEVSVDHTRSHTAV
jgi:hypothetical protein